MEYILLQCMRHGAVLHSVGSPNIKAFETRNLTVARCCNDTEGASDLRDVIAPETRAYLPPVVATVGGRQGALYFLRGAGIQRVPQK